MAALFDASPPSPPQEVVALTMGEFDQVKKKLEEIAAAQEAEAAAAEYPTGAIPLLRAATELFTKTFGAAPSLAAQAPGRVNLIGEHTDYTGGFVLPLALEKRTVVVGSGAVVDATEGGEAGDSDMCQVLSLGIDGPVAAFDADPAVLVPGDPGWANYVKGVVAQYSADLPSGKKFAFRAVYASDVPPGAGLSSSAALEVSTATLLEQLEGYPRRAATDLPSKQQKAARCQAAEHAFCAMPCGIMDQFISALGQQGHLLQVCVLYLCLDPPCCGGGSVRAASSREKNKEAGEELR